MDTVISIKLIVSQIDEKNYRGTIIIGESILHYEMELLWPKEWNKGAQFQAAMNDYNTISNAYRFKITKNGEELYILPSEQQFFSHIILQSQLAFLQAYPPDQIANAKTVEFTMQLKASKKMIGILRRPKFGCKI